MKLTLNAKEIAEDSRKKRLDPSDEVEIYIAEDVASRTEGLVGPKGVAKRLKIMEKEENLSKDQIVIQIAKEIARGDFGGTSPEDMAEQAIRTALSYQTEGITAAPIEGISKVSIKSNNDNTMFLAVYYSGPIRSAGGTAQGVSVIIADVVRRELGLAKYKATEEEINRMHEETRLYNRIMHLQIPTSDEELKFVWKHIPIMITGDPTESEEVGGYRNIETMETNRVRGGACLVLNDGLTGRAAKIYKRIKKLKITDWEWLGEVADGKYSDKKVKKSKSEVKQTKVLPDFSFIEDALMGRPTFSGPTTPGGFRLRYGHARNTGIAAIGINSAVMAVVDDYLAPGTHIRTERPGKGGIVAPIDTIRGPIVRLKDGSVVEVNDYETGKALQPKIEKIIFLGDLLVGYGEFLQNNYKLCPVGYNHEWWLLELSEKTKSYSDYKDENSITFDQAIHLSKTYEIPLHPKYVPAWDNLSISEIQTIQDQFSTKNQFSRSLKPLFEKLWIPHLVSNQSLELNNDFFESLKIQIASDNAKPNEELKLPLEYINYYSSVYIRDIVGTSIGARMGRPEKAKERKMKPVLHGLFPLGNEKSIDRRLQKAREAGKAAAYMADRFCSSCSIATYFAYCPICHEETQVQGTCTNKLCGAKMEENPCDICGSTVSFTKYWNLNIHELLDHASRELGPFISDIDVKLKKQLKNVTGLPEILEKGILRAKYDLNVFRDGTIRYDSTDVPLTHFYPYEINVDIEKLNELGYTLDYLGNPLISSDQLVELKTQDIIVHKSCIVHLSKVATFIDDELELIYGMDRYYNLKSPEDILGHLVIGLAPHTSAGVIGRVIGSCQSSVCFAHPYWHSAKRRNCDGDEDGVILLLDGFLNFSKQYLPTTRGSKMDTPLVLVVTMNPNEVDDEAFNLDNVTSYPLELYKNAKEILHPNTLENKITRIGNVLGTENQFENFNFTHHTKNIDDGPLVTRYKAAELKIRDKLEEQLALAEKIAAVDEHDIALKILEKHVLPDLMGNLRAFSSQQVRCITCNTKYRRVPLVGHCINPKCSRSNLVLTVPPRGVSKYFDICLNLINRYDLGKYHVDRMEKIELALRSEKSQGSTKQLDLTDWLN